jgi:fructose-1,6-bisphosphatase/inositol monophosphatase family enzyme
LLISVLLQKTYPWDYGAGKIVLEEAGGAVKKFNNEQIMINETDGIIAAASDATILKTIEQYLQKEG